MRTKDELFMLGEVSTLLQYLFMSEKHTIIFNNGLTDLQIRMDENFNIWCRNLQFPDIPESDFSEQLSTVCLVSFKFFKIHLQLNLKMRLQIVGRKSNKSPWLILL